MSEEIRNSDEPTPEAIEAKAPEMRRNGIAHWLVGAGAIASILFIVTLWTIKGGSLQSFKFSDAEVAELAPSTTPAITAPYSVMAPATAPQQALVPVTPTAPVSVQGPAGAVAPQPVVAMAVAPNGMPVFVAPNGVINPMTMMNDPRYYQQWGQVGVTFVNPFAYQHIMNQMMLNSMQAWGMNPPATVSAEVKGAPQG